MSDGTIRMLPQGSYVTFQSGSTQPVLNLARIRKTLFDDPAIAAKITRDYDLTTHKPFEEQIREKLGQEVAKDVDLSDETAFKAATLAIASSMRQWALVYRGLGAIKQLLMGYDPQQVATAAQNPAQRGAMVRSLASLLGGQRAHDHAEWIIRFGESLAVTPRIQTTLLAAKAAAGQRAPNLSEAQLNAAVALLLARGSGPRSLAHNGIALRKAVGMGPPIASEFLRNLGWASFKPDRHIIRLLSAWLPERDREEITSSVDWSPMFRRRSGDARQFLDFAVLGEKLTPDCEPLNQADQLVWMMGVYVQRKPRNRRPT